jgi:CheY-like chemotaxis protein
LSPGWLPTDHRKVIRVLVVEHPEAVRRALCSRLSLEPYLVLLDAVGDPASAGRRAEALRPDVSVIDTEMPDLDLPAAARALRAGSPSSRLVVLGVDTGALGRWLPAAGAILVGKDEGVAALLGAMRRVPPVPTASARPAGRNPRDDRGPPAGRALKLDAAADRGRPLAHRAEAKVAGERAGRVEADPVVADT